MANSLAPEIVHVAPSLTADAFLWEHVVDLPAVPEDLRLVPVGMFDQWPLEVLLRITKPFTGLVVLVDLTSSHRRPAHNETLLQSVTAFVAGLLGESDFGCRTTEDEFVMIFAGLEGAAAQRRLNRLSEQIWEFQQRGRGTFSIVFSWGGIGAPEKPLSEAMLAAVHRMNRINQNRHINSKKSVKHRRKVV